jgi:hypothetical protein
MSPLAKKRAAAGALLIVLGAVTWFLAQPHAPAGQPPLVTLDVRSLDSLRDAFNRDAAHVRVLILQSPT